MLTWIKRAPICAAVALAAYATDVEGQRINTVLRLSRSANDHIVGLGAIASDSAPPGRPLVLIGALVGASAGGVVYAHSIPDDGDFGGLGAYFCVGGGLVAGTLVGYFVSVLNERNHPGAAARSF
jgi:hypothetical protein